MADLWNTLQKMEVNSKDVWLGDLAEHYGIDYEKRQISVRGHIYYADMADGGEKEDSLLTIETETARSGCHAFFHAINRKLKGGLSISYRETESGCGIYYVHDEGGFFTEVPMASLSTMSAMMSIPPLQMPLVNGATRQE